MHGGSCESIASSSHPPIGTIDFPATAALARTANVDGVAMLLSRALGHCVGPLARAQSRTLRTPPLPSPAAHALDRVFGRPSADGTPPALSVASVCDRLAEVFQRHGIPEAALSAQHLIAKALARSQDFAAVRAMHDQPWQHERTAVLRDYAGRRLAREPIQHIVGEWDFHNINLETCVGVLCPRPETEELVEQCLGSVDTDRGGRGNTAGGCVASAGSQGVRVLDIGAGTGAIGLALLHARQHWRCDAIDIDPLAVELALRNARANGVETRYTCAQMDVAGLPHAAMVGLYDLIVSNPPYIPAADRPMLQPEVVDYERPAALFSGADGMDVIRVLLAVAPKLLGEQCAHATVCAPVACARARCAACRSHRHVAPGCCVPRALPLPGPRGAQALHARL